MERVEIPGGCIGYWHWPDSWPGAGPALVMGQGFGTEWGFGAQSTRDAFNKAGLAVFTFDYRHFGESLGQPRQLVSIARQLEDWRAVLRLVRADPRTDPSRLAVWGSSMGGGHALRIAAEDHGLAAVLAQVPLCSALAGMPATPLLASLRITAHALFDAFLGLLGGVHEISLFGEPGEVAAMTFAGWKQPGLELAGASTTWRNVLPARSMLSVIGYRPGARASRIRCPVCIHYARDDRGVSPASIERTIKRIAHVEAHPFAGDHFDVYFGEQPKRILADQIDFLRRLGVASPSN